MREYVKPDARYMRLATALCSPLNASFGHAVLKDRPASTYTVEVEVRYIDKSGKQIGDTLGFEVLSEEATAEVGESEVTRIEPRDPRKN